MSVQERVPEIIANTLNVDKDKVTTCKFLSEDLHVDSLDAVELIMALEDEFEIKIPDKDADDCKTVGQVIEYIEKRLAKIEK